MRESDKISDKKVVFYIFWIFGKKNNIQINKEHKQTVKTITLSVVFQVINKCY